MDFDYPPIGDSYSVHCLMKLFDARLSYLFTTLSIILSLVPTTGNTQNIALVRILT